jgi:hypothetical protein
MVSDNDPGLPQPRGRVAELAAHPDGVRWARDCAWVPGTGHCRNRRCSSKCLFREERTAEVQRVARARRQRRPSQLPGAERPAPASAALLVLRRLLRGVLA